MTHNSTSFKLFTAAILGSLGFCLNSAHAWQSDNGDDTFTNPPLYADYPDPDIIRVSNDFYFATTTFVNSPGLTILHSQDLVNWEIVSHVISRLDGSPQYDMTNGTAYRNGVYAPSLRYYDGTFYVVVTPNGMNTRVYYASNASGPWQCHPLSVSAFDPGLFIETNGVGYIFTSGGWDGHVTVHTLNADFSQVVATSNNVFYYSGIEGSKVVKRGNYYYCFNAHPGDLSLKISRATSIFGIWETISSISDGSGGGHQGAIVDLPDGRDFGFIMKDSGAVGRMTYISPIVWSNGWPYWGTSNALNHVPATVTKPILGKPVMQPETSDDFSSSTLGLQWQWNHNPDNSRWSLTERPGYLRLRPTQATGFWTARNTLTQKGQGPWSHGVIKMDISNLQAGDRCGFGTLGKISAYIVATRDGGGHITLGMDVINDSVSSETRATGVPFSGTNLLLRTEMDFKTSTGLCAYSPDGVSWTTLGGSFPLMFDWQTGTFQGEQFAIFCYNPSPGSGYVDVDYFSSSDSVGPPPAAPSGLSATAVSSFQINLAWNSSTNATSYNVRRSTTDGSSYTTIATDVGATNYSDAGVAPGTTYYYVVRAVNAGGESTNSAPASATTPQSSTGTLVHRYAFNESTGTTVADSIGGATWNGTLPRGGSFSGGQLTLSSGSQQYMNLPAGILSNLSAVTIESWATFAPNLPWATWFFGFGDVSGGTGGNCLFCSEGGGRVAVSSRSPSYLGETNAYTSGLDWSGKTLHIACVFNPPGGYLAIYTNGVVAGTNSSGTLTMNSIVNNYSYINRSLYSADPYVDLTINEFRIYNAALSAPEIAATEALGPDQLLTTENPTVNVTTTPTDLTFTWRLASAGFTLQSRTNLIEGDWVDVTSTAPQIIGGRWQATLPFSAEPGSLYYRLIR